ncbi:hypothetical protein UY3_06449 [Chelonia mydas]|uniref:Uncharacterized protein n=1 Tax=Chelonia mydas TaxID=8469 RepID=M7BKY5_CHEMY|nr:hypothetical protein UY3_06449 [Chelonia mydas]
MDTCKRGVAQSEEDELLEDEEEKEEDSAQATSGELVFPHSQELFLTLDPIASPNPNVSSWTMTLEKPLLIFVLISHSHNGIAEIVKNKLEKIVAAQ